METLVFSTDYPPLWGGISTYSYEIAKELFNLGDEVIVLTQRLKGDREFDSRQPFETIRVPNIPFLRELMFLVCAFFIIKNKKIDRVFCPLWFPAGVITYLVTRCLKVPYFVAAYASEILDSKISFRQRIKSNLKPLKILTFMNANRIMPISRYTKGKLLEMGISEEKNVIIHGGVDTEKFAPNIDCEKIISKFGLNKKKVILTVARLDQHKGHDMVIKSLSRVLKEIPNLVYLIVGDGPERKRLEEMVKEFGLKKEVIFIGFIPYSDIPQFYTACDVYIMPSREMEERPDLIEGFGIAYLEASATGKPVIGGRSGGVSDAIIDKETGLLVNPINVDEISQALIMLLKDDNYARRLGRNGRERVKKEFKWENIARKIKLEMDKICSANFG